MNRLLNQPPLRLLRAFLKANAKLTTAVVATGALAGALVPAFMLASGALVGAIRAGDATATPMVAVAGVFLVGRLLEPLREELAFALWRHVDESLTQRLMRTMSQPAGLAHAESPAVLDRVRQAQGVLTGITPGESAFWLGFVVSLWVQGAGSLLIVAFYEWWLAPVLVAGYAVAYRISRRHWHDVTLVMYERTPRLRRAYYLRTLALEPAVAKETRVFGLAGWLVDRYRQGWLSEMRQIWRARNEGWVVTAVAAAVLVGVEALALALVADDAVDGRLGLGAAVAVAQAVIGAAVLGVYDDGNWHLSECVRSVGRIEEVERQAAEALGVAGGAKSARALPRNVIRFEGVTFAYPETAEPVLEGFDLELPAGRSLALVGENGAGKTTLVKLLCRLYDPDAGAITVDGIDLRELSPLSWQRRVAAVFQDFVQFELPAYDNVAYGALHRRDDAAGVAEAARLAGADHIVARLEHGWATPLSRQFSGGTQLSGGEWQRLALARALFAIRAGAGLLILDEPTAALDVRGEAEVYERFLEITRGVTTIVVSHRFSTMYRLQATRFRPAEATGA
jgi:ATP-binding cassette subfamily B protein